MGNKYRPVFKCRLCGEEFSHKDIDDISQSAFYLSRMCVQSKGNNLPFEHHMCKDGNIGIGDLLGCKKIESED